MAKLNAPLFSFNASGQIAKALVYFGWKGLDVVRSYVTPSNPRTTLQTIQRGYLTACVAFIHTTQAQAARPLIEADINAYAALGNTKKTPRTWFNEICRLWLITEGAGDTPCLYTYGGMQSTAHDAARCRAWINELVPSDMTAGKFYLGTSPTALIKVKAAEGFGGDQVIVPGATAYDDLVAGVKYYWQFRPDVADKCEHADSGIYNFVAT